MAAPIGTLGDQRRTFRLIRQQCATNGLPSTLTALGYANNQLTTLGSLSDGWAMSEFSASGQRLPDGVQFELWILPEALTVAGLDATHVVAWQYNGTTYQIVRESPFKPEAIDRFWRFWISPQEPEQ